MIITLLSIQLRPGKRWRDSFVLFIFSQRWRTICEMNNGNIMNSGGCFQQSWSFTLIVKLTEFATQHITWCIEVAWKPLGSPSLHCFGRGRECQWSDLWVVPWECSPKINVALGPRFACRFLLQKFNLFKVWLRGVALTWSFHFLCLLLCTVSM